MEYMERRSQQPPNNRATTIGVSYWFCIQEKVRFYWQALHPDWGLYQTISTTILFYPRYVLRVNECIISFEWSDNLH